MLSFSGMFKSIFSKIPSRYLIATYISIMVIVPILAIGILLIRNNKSPQTPQTPQVEGTSTVTKEVDLSEVLSEKETIIEEVSKLITLPAGEIPIIATVTDADNLNSQPLFKDAQNGYKVLIYAQAKKAIVYDPVNKKIINIGPINIDTSFDSATPASSLVP